MISVKIGTEIIVPIFIDSVHKTRWIQRKNVDNFICYDRMRAISKCNAEAKQLWAVSKREGDGENPLPIGCKPLLRCPG